MIRLALVSVLALASCATAAPPEPATPAGLMAAAWAAPYSYDPASDCRPSKAGQCCNKVSWAIEELGRGQMVTGWRNIGGQGRNRHAALLVDGIVFDVDGSWPLASYPMTIEEIK